MSEKKEKFLTRNYILMLLLNCIYGVSQNFITTPLAKQGVAIGLSMTTIGTIASAVTIIAMICRPIFGNFMDRINIKKVLYLALGCLFLSFALIGLGSNNNAVFYTVGRLVYGAGFSAVGTCLAAATSLSVSKTQIASGISVFLMAPMILKTFTPNISMWLIETYGYKVNGLVAAVLLATGFICVAQLDISQQHRSIALKEKEPFKLSNLIAKEAVPPAIVNVCFGMLTTAVVSNIIVYGDNMGIANVVMFMTIYNACNIFTRGCGGFIADKLGVRALMYPCLLCATGALLVLAFFPTLPMVCVAAVLYSLGFSGSMSTVQTMCIRSVEAERAGVANSTYYLSADLGGIIINPIVGIILDSVGFQFMYLTMLIPVVIATVVFTVIMATMGDRYARKSEISAS